jgi:hypothetical protein
MRKKVGIGHQDFEKIRTENVFYVDKTAFIREWWEEADEVTLITRPRRFGKTLNMSMLEKFFSVDYAGREDLFQGLAVWEDENYRNLQGTYPVISLSFANIKEMTYKSTIYRINQIITDLYSNYRFLLEGKFLSPEEKVYLKSISDHMSEETVTMAIHRLSKFLYAYYGKKVIILLDEYDTPMQEAYVNGFWNELVSFIRNMFNAAFKTNPYLERAIMTGITRVSKESIFSDLNNLEVITTTSEKYADCFGFTEGEVFAALDEYDLSEKKEEVKAWYDGFIFGNRKDIYNPWSILNYMDKRQIGTYWANSSSNSLVGKLIREGNAEIKMVMERLIQGEAFHTSFDEQIVFSQLDQDDSAVWSLFMASGYLKPEYAEFNVESGKMEYQLKLTNREVYFMFQHMIEGWFGKCREVHNAFLQALLSHDLEGMNEYMNEISDELFSSFDTGKKPSGKAQPERFYHGFVLGLMVELRGRYSISSNKESGYGRYDIMMEPREKGADAYIIEFKVVHTKRGETLESAVQAALKQIEEKKYDAELCHRGVPRERIRKYGFAFSGKDVMIGEAIEQTGK